MRRKMTKNVVARIDLNRAADGYVGVVQFVLAARGNYARHFSGLPSWVSLCLGRGLACSSGTCSPKLVVEGAMWRGGRVESLYMSTCSRGVLLLVWFARQWVVGHVDTVLLWGGSQWMVGGFVGSVGSVAGFPAMQRGGPSVGSLVRVDQALRGEGGAATPVVQLGAFSVARASPAFFARSPFCVVVV